MKTKPEVIFNFLSYRDYTDKRRHRKIVFKTCNVQIMLVSCGSSPFTEQPTPLVVYPRPAMEPVVPYKGFRGCERLDIQAPENRCCSCMCSQSKNAKAPGREEFIFPWPSVCVITAGSTPKLHCLYQAVGKQSSEFDLVKMDL